MKNTVSHSWMFCTGLLSNHNPCLKAIPILTFMVIIFLLCSTVYLSLHPFIIWFSFACIWTLHKWNHQLCILYVWLLSSKQYICVIHLCYVCMQFHHLPLYTYYIITQIYPKHNHFTADGHMSCLWRRGAGGCAIVNNAAKRLCTCPKAHSSIHKYDWYSSGNSTAQPLDAITSTLVDDTKFYQGSLHTQVLFITCI